MGAHGIRNRPPQRRFTDPLPPPPAPSMLALLWPLVGIAVVLAGWLVAVTLIISH